MIEIQHLKHRYSKYLALSTNMKIGLTLKQIRSHRSLHGLQFKKRKKKYLFANIPPSFSFYHEIGYKESGCWGNMNKWINPFKIQHVLAFDQKYLTIQVFLVT